jgi:hypothetical protein
MQLACLRVCLYGCMYMWMDGWMGVRLASSRTVGQILFMFSIQHFMVQRPVLRESEHSTLGAFQMAPPQNDGFSRN